MHVAITSALTSAFTKHRASFASLHYQMLTVPESPLTADDFPYDVTFLSYEVLEEMIAKSKKYRTEFWPIERIRAYQGKDICAKRAAVTGFLWQRYCEYPKMSLGLLQKWVEVEALEQQITIPTWFRNQHPHEEIARLWQEKLGPKREAYIKRHQKVLEEIQQLL